MALLFPWRLAMEGYAPVLAAPAAAVMHAIDPGVAIQADGPELVYTRLYPAVRVHAATDKRENPLVLRWMFAISDDFARSLYPEKRTRAFINVERADTYRMTLELPLLLALIFAIPGLPWRTRWKPLLLGLAVLFAVHVFLATCPGTWLSVREAALTIDAHGNIVDPTDRLWLQVADRYQFVGPVFAFILVIAMLMGGLFLPRSKRRPATATPDSPTPATADSG